MSSELRSSQRESWLNAGRGPRSWVDYGAVYKRDWFIFIIDSINIQIMTEQNILDVQGQQPGLYKLYTQLCCVFPVAETSSQDAIISTLRSGMDRLRDSFPWLAGEVVNEDASDGNTGVYRITPSDSIPLVVQDLQDDASAPTMETLRKAGYPCSMLDENIFAPGLTLNLPTNFGLAAESAFVFAIQANFIAGGLVLTSMSQHNVMDMTGQAQILDWLSKACYSLPFTEEEVSLGNPDRTRAISLLDEPYEPGPELAPQMLPQLEEPAGDLASSQLLKSTWAYLKFSALSLDELKSLATSTLPYGFVSTDDTICAFLWKCISRARIPRLQPGAKSTFARAVDVRQHVGLPATYPGMLQNMTYSTNTLQDLGDTPLGTTAAELRAKLTSKDRDLAYATRSLLTYISRSKDKTKTSPMASVDMSSGIALSSWSKINAYDLDFNLGLGKPEAVRRPGFTPVEGLLYLMPKSPNGDLAVQVCLRDEDWGRLRIDEEFMKYTTYLG
ncbi:uncharacterized protein N7443_008007 [Penicillium atrosanguineum]|uniref:uncharacterized protein n=1 Tax=Penicillium atrosanguineum TaxID=1132637 RepID=UPI0023922085|nr:uncharacterized protein N7443_008007 [Penicillium atrosanguineum]KAJ5297114.1 hypothetical protein N7443_008007 [Penicillium atrosanguineum]